MELVYDMGIQNKIIKTLKTQSKSIKKEKDTDPWI